MELLARKEPLKYQHKEITFLIKPQSSAADRMEIALSGTHEGGGRITISRVDVARTLIQRFVVGWQGVTDNGQPVPFSMEALDRLPDDGDTLLNLFGFIADNTDIFKSKEHLKNGSRGPLIGACRVAPSPASEKIA